MGADGIFLSGDPQYGHAVAHRVFLHCDERQSESLGRSRKPFVPALVYQTALGSYRRYPQDQKMVGHVDADRGGHRFCRHGSAGSGSGGRFGKDICLHPHPVHPHRPFGGYLRRGFGWYVHDQPEPQPAIHLGGIAFDGLPSRLAAGGWRYAVAGGLCGRRECKTAQR